MKEQVPDWVGNPFHPVWYTTVAIALALILHFTVPVALNRLITSHRLRRTRPMEPVTTLKIALDCAAEGKRVVLAFGTADKMVKSYDTARQMVHRNAAGTSVTNEVKRTITFHDTKGFVDFIVVSADVVDGRLKGKEYDLGNARALDLEDLRPWIGRERKEDAPAQPRTPSHRDQAV